MEYFKDIVREIMSKEKDCILEIRHEFADDGEYSWRDNVNEMNKDDLEYLFSKNYKLDNLHTFEKRQNRIGESVITLFHK